MKRVLLFLLTLCFCLPAAPASAAGGVTVSDPAGDALPNTLAPDLVGALDVTSWSLSGDGDSFHATMTVADDISLDSLLQTDVSLSYTWSFAAPRLQTTQECNVSWEDPPDTTCGPYENARYAFVLQMNRSGTYVSVHVIDETGWQIALIGSATGGVGGDGRSVSVDVTYEDESFYDTLWKGYVIVSPGDQITDVSVETAYDACVCLYPTVPVPFGVGSSRRSDWSPDDSYAPLLNDRPHQTSPHGFTA